MSPPGLTAVAGWDVPRLRGAVVTLAEVAARLPAWRFRLEGLGRSLDTAECWSGPAAHGAAAAVADLSAAAAAVGAGLSRSTEFLEVLAGEATTAQELAETTLALAARWPDALEPRAAPDGAARAADALVPGALPEPAAASFPGAAALRHAAAAAAAAAEAGAALAGLAVDDAFAPADFGDLVSALGPVVPVAIPAGSGPEEAARWWAGLPAAGQQAVLAAAPAAVGGLDGVPAWARDRANRLLLARALVEPDGPGWGTAVAVSAQLAAAESGGRPVQLYSFDPVAGLVAVAFGDLDAAAAVALLVPGVFTTAPDDLGGLVGDARDVADAARSAAPGLAVATVAWLGYRTPDDPLEILTRGDARRGGAALDRALTGLAAARSAWGRRRARTTVVAHSYGTVVVDQAADRPGPLAADAVVLLGSPGMQGAGAAGLEAPEVYDAAAVLDPISWSGWFGRDPWSDRYGATLLACDWDTRHSEYYDRDRPTLAAIGAVVAGTGAVDGAVR